MKKLHTHTSALLCLSQHPHLRPTTTLPLLDPGKHIGRGTPGDREVGGDGDCGAGRSGEAEGGGDSGGEGDVEVEGGGEATGDGVVWAAREWRSVGNYAANLSLSDTQKRRCADGLRPPQLKPKPRLQHRPPPKMINPPVYHRRQNHQRQKKWPKEAPPGPEACKAFLSISGLLFTIDAPFDTLSHQ